MGTTVANFTVLAVDSFAGEVRGIDKFECCTISEAHRKAGELAANRNGVIILDEHDGVWFEFRPAQIERITSAQRIFYRHYEKRAVADRVLA
jgi:hypothetical protein